MKRTVLFFSWLTRIFTAVLIFLACPGFAAADTPAKSSVWEISRNGRVLYLGGTVHLLRGSDYPLPKVFDVAYSKSAVLVLEADVNRASSPQAMAYIQEQALLPEGKTLPDVLSREMYSRLEAEFRKVNPSFSLDALAMYKPEVLLNALASLYYHQMGITQPGVDAHYLAKAKDENKSLEFFETVEFQSSLMYNRGRGDENAYVKYELAEIASLKETYGILSAEWREGKAPNLEALLQAQKDQGNSVYGSMVLDRNNAWMTKIEEYLSTDTVECIFVGLAHVAGPDGLLKQLEAKGCTIKQPAY